MHVMQKPMIAIDLKKSRIRIFKQTLRLLGNPEYVVLLVNPDNSTIAVGKAVISQSPAYHINCSTRMNQQACELYSVQFIQSLHHLCPRWKKDQVYRLYGDVIPSKGLVQFNLHQIVVVDKHCTAEM